MSLVEPIFVVLFLSFLCSPVLSIVEVDCKTSFFQPQCNSDSRIQINSAIYSRTNRSICNPNNTAAILTLNCTASVEVYIKSQCEGKTTCYINNFSSVLFDINNPCLNTDKYLTVDWICAPLLYNTTHKVDQISDGNDWIGICPFGVIQINYVTLGNLSDCFVNITDAVIQKCEGKPVCNMEESLYSKLENPCETFGWPIFTIDWECTPIPIVQPMPGSDNYDETLNFVVLGDYGGQSTYPYTTPTQLAVAVAIGKAASSIFSSFVISLGDNFYYSGVASATDSRFASTWENVFTDPSLHTKWYQVVGNHDYYGSVQAQVDFGALPQKDKDWYLPNLSYDEVWTIPNTNRTVHAIFFDTFQLTSESHAEVPVDTSWANAQVAWLESVLSRSYSHWKFLFTHYPFVSVGNHGPNPEIESILQPILEKYKIDIYMTGHDHNQQHIIKPGTWNVNHYVIGGAHVLEALSLSSISSIPSSWVQYTYPPIDQVQYTTDTICPGKTWAPSCPDGGTISISTTFYGRLDNSTCLPQIKTELNLNCFNNVSSEVNNYCSGKSFCLLNNSRGSLGIDPCGGDSYLQINWICYYQEGGFASISVSPNTTYVSIYTQSGLTYQNAIIKDISMELPPFPPEPLYQLPKIPPVWDTPPVVPPITKPPTLTPTGVHTPTINTPTLHTPTTTPSTPTNTPSNPTTTTPTNTSSTPTNTPSTPTNTPSNPTDSSSPTGTPPTSTNTPSNPTTGPTDSGSSPLTQDKATSTGVIVGVVVSLVVLALILVGIIVWVVCFKKPFEAV